MADVGTWRESTETHAAEETKRAAFEALREAIAERSEEVVEAEAESESIGGRIVKA